MSYSKIRLKSIGLINTIVYNLKSLIPFKIFLKKFFKLHTKNQISKKDLVHLRDILGHKNGIVDRKLLRYINDNVYKDHLNYLYDCLELNVNSKSLSSNQTMQLCRLVNLQIMMTQKE